MEFSRGSPRRAASTLEEVPAHLLEDKINEDLHHAARERLSEMRSQIADAKTLSFGMIVCDSGSDCWMGTTSSDELAEMAIALMFGF